jgi:hypothetical protein
MIYRPINAPGQAEQIESLGDRRDAMPLKRNYRTDSFN